MCPHETIEKVELERKGQNRAETTPNSTPSYPGILSRVRQHTK